MEEIHRTPKQWEETFLSLAREINSDFRRNNKIRGNKVEFIREHHTGLFISQNYYRSGNSGTFSAPYSYNHGFALALILGECKQLENPLEIGLRCDRSDGAWKYFDMAGISRRGLHSHHMGRKGATALVRQSMRLFEARLLPVFLAQIRARKSALLEIVETALGLVENIRSGKIDIFSLPPPQFDWPNILRSQGLLKEGGEAKLDGRDCEIFNLAQLLSARVRIDPRQFALRHYAWRAERSPYHYFSKIASEPTHSPEEICHWIVRYFGDFNRNSAELPRVGQVLRRL